MKNVLTITILTTILPIIILGCQKDYIEDFNDIETESIVFEWIIASCDTANMFDTIILTAVAKAQNFQYKWQRAKGTLIPFNYNPSKAYFWGCPTCIGDITVSCTVSNGSGQYTKDKSLYIFPYFSCYLPEYHIFTEK
ncbi:MAG: hypothetical protein ACI358_01225 [Candidatus Limimorpha sp.]